jgi:hypothetical protein
VESRLSFSFGKTLEPDHAETAGTLHLSVSAERAPEIPLEGGVT